MIEEVVIRMGKHTWRKIYVASPKVLAIGPAACGHPWATPYVDFAPRTGVGMLIGLERLADNAERLRSGAE